MAQKKIGALIALDGEKEFRQSVTDCNKSLTTLKSEMSLVKAESEGQANSLEALQKKHDVLSRVLEEQEKKQEAVATGLNHARESYDKVGKGLDGLRGNLEDAKTALEEMKKSSSATEEELQSQEKTVKELAAAVEKGEKNYQSAATRIKDWEAKLNTAKAQTIKANGELNKNAAYLKEAEEATDHCATSIDEFGKTTQKATEFTQSYTEIIRNNLINTAVDAAKSMVSSALSTVTEFEDAANQLQASTGASAAAMEKYKTVMDDVYDNNYGESFDDIADASQKVVQTLGEMDPSALQETTESAITLRDTFGFDYQEQLRAVKQMMENFGVSSEDAYNLIVQGAQQGLDKNGDLLDTINEYSPYYSLAGRSASDFFNSLKNGAEEGTFSVDMLGDAYKEFTLKAKDTANTTTEAYQILGLNAAEMRSQFAAGGESAKAATDVILESLFSIDDDVKRNQAGVDLFGTKWEDLGEKGIKALTNMNGEISETKDAMEEIKEIKYDSLTNKYEQLGRKFKTEVAAPIAEDFLPVAEEGLEILIDNTDKLIPLVGGVAAGFAGFKIASFVSESVTAVKDLRVATEGAATAQELFNAVAGVNPYVLLAGAAVAAVTAIALFSASTQDAVTEADKLKDSADELSESLESTTEDINNIAADWEGTIGGLEAEGNAAKDLATELFDVKRQTGDVTEKKVRMENIVSQLNELFPDLALSINKETGALNKNKEEVFEAIEASMAYKKAKEAEKELEVIVKKQTDAEIEQYKAIQTVKDIENEKKNLEKERIRISKEGIDGTVEYNGAMQKTTDATILLNEQEEELNQKQKELRERNAELDESLVGLNEEYSDVNSYMQEQIDKSGEVAAAKKEEAAAAQEAAEASNNAMQLQTQLFGDASEAALTSAATISSAYDGVKESVTNALESQMDMFTHFEEGTQLSTEQMLQNMQSQIDGVENWSENLKVLAERGINENLLQYLAELGPEGAGYVATFSQMGADELSKASDLWAQSLDIKSGVSEKISGMMDEVVTAMSGGPEKVQDILQQCGYDSVTGLVQGVNEYLSQVESAGLNIGDTLIGSVRESLDSHSPSLKMHVAGQDASVGLSNGVLSKYSSVQNSSRLVSEVVLSETGNVLQYGTFYNFGQNVTAGLAQGILDGRSSVVSAISSMCESAIAQAKADLDIHSPSKVFASLGEYSAEGYGQGFERQMESIHGTITDSLRFAAPPQEQAAMGADASIGNLENTIENALYNGIIYAMSRAKTENGLGDVQVTISVGKQDITNVMVEADREHRMRTGGIGILEG